MRDFQGLNAASIPDTLDKVEKYLPILRRDMVGLDYFLRDLSRGLARIQKGQVPDGSGDPIPIADDGFFWKLLGRSGGQHGRGGTLAGESATISSTVHATKGFVYFGAAQSSAYDETNDRFGIGITSPAANLHIDSPTTAEHLRVSAIGANGLNTGSPVWVNQLGSSVNADLVAALDEVVATDSDYVTRQMNGGVFKFHITAGTDPVINTGHIMRIRCKASALGVGGKLTFGLVQGNTTIVEAGGAAGIPGGTGVTPAGTELPLSFTTYEYTLSSSEAAAITDYTDLYLSWSNGQGVDAGQSIFVSWAELELPGSSGEILQRWSENTSSYVNDLQWTLDGNGVKTLELSGTPKFRIATTGLEFDIGTPASGKFWTATDAEGTGQWSTVTYNTFPLNVVSITTDYTALTTDNVILGDGIITLTLYTAVGNTGKQLFIKNMGLPGFSRIIVDGAGTETVDGNLTLDVGQQYNCMALTSNGTNWVIV